PRDVAQHDVGDRPRGDRRAAGGARRAMSPSAPVAFADAPDLTGRCDVSPWTAIDRRHLDAFAFATYLTAPDLEGDAEGPPPGADLVDGFLLLSLTAHAGHALPVIDPATTYA